MTSVKYIGLDVHQATIVVAVLYASGKLVMESVVETRASTILEFISGIRAISTGVCPNSLVESVLVPPLTSPRINLDQATARSFVERCVAKVTFHVHVCSQPDETHHINPVGPNHGSMKQGIAADASRIYIVPHCG